MAVNALKMAYLVCVCFILCLGGNLLSVAGGVSAVAMAIMVAPIAVVVVVLAKLWSTFLRTEGPVNTRAEAAAKSLVQSCTGASGNVVDWRFKVASFTVRCLVALCVMGTSVCVMMWFATVGGWCVVCWMLVSPSEWHPTSKHGDWVFSWVEPTWLVKCILRIELSTEWTCSAAADTLQEGSSDGAQPSRTAEGSSKRRHTTQGDTQGIPDNNGSSSRTGNVATRSLVDAFAATIGIDSSNGDGSLASAQSMWGSIMTLRAPQLLPEPTAVAVAHHGLVQNQANFVKYEIRRIDSMSSGGSSSSAGEVVGAVAREMSAETAAAVAKSRSIVEAMAECMAQLRATGLVD